MNKLYIPIIFAAATEKRQSYTELCAHATKIFVEKADINTEIIDAQKEIQFCHVNRNINTPEVRALREKLNRADGFIIVSPEYNHGYPGDLKNLLDSFLDEYNRKPVGIIGVSSGGIGGARVVEQLRLVAIALAMVPLNGAIYFSGAAKLFNDDKTFNAEKAYESRFKKFLDELVWYAEALKVARKK